MPVSDKSRLEVADHVLKTKRKGQSCVLRENMLHLWCISRHEFEPFLPVLRQILSEDESARAGRYHFDKDRIRFILRRGILRILISLYLEVDPQQIKFRYGKNGKPVVADHSLAEQLKFSMAFSENIMLYAFSLNREVGVDIEQVRNVPEAEQIINTYFSETEKTYFNRLSADLQDEAFFKLWTRKEAILKATGTGLDESISRIDVTSPDVCLPTPKQQEPSGRWHVEDLSLAPGFSAAYAIEGGQPLKVVFD